MKKRVSRYFRLKKIRKFEKRLKTNVDTAERNFLLDFFGKADPDLTYLKRMFTINRITKTDH